MENIYTLLTGSPEPSTNWLPRYREMYQQEGIRLAYQHLLEAGLVPAPSESTDRPGRRFVCKACDGSGSSYDQYGERPCPYCREHPTEDILLPTTLEALVCWASLGLDTIQKIEAQASIFLDWAKEHGWESAEGTRKIFSRELFGPPHVTWVFNNMVRLVDRLPDGPMSEVIAFLSRRDQVCFNDLQGPISCRVDGTLLQGDGIIDPIREIWNMGVIPARLDTVGIRLWVPFNR